jgi:hypothetical protein
MANNAQHQRRKAAKAARRKAIVAEKKRLGTSGSGLVGRVQFAARFPVALCVMPSELFEIGIGHVVIGRELPSGLLACGFFLVDVFCLGVKDAHFAEMEPDQVHAFLAASDGTQTFVDVAPACACKLIEGAVDYADDLDLAPAKDFGVVQAIFGDIEPDACSDTFTFGKDGKPFYVPGPLDTPARIRAVTLALQNRLGVDGSNRLIEAVADAPAGEEEAPDDR